MSLDISINVHGTGKAIVSPTGSLDFIARDQDRTYPSVTIHLPVEVAEAAAEVINAGLCDFRAKCASRDQLAHFLTAQKGQETLAVLGGVLKDKPEDMDRARKLYAAHLLENL